MKLVSELYLHDRFFYALLLCVLGFVASFYLELLFPLFQAILVVCILLISADLFILFQKGLIVHAERSLPKLFSLGDTNHIHIRIKNRSRMPLEGYMIDEIPSQFQIRNFKKEISIPALARSDLEYDLTPKTRGNYRFGKIHIFTRSFIGFVHRRISINCEATVPCYPSIIQMKRYDLKNLLKISRIQGIKKIRRIGHSYEFDQIKKYVHGDDYRSINWKATSRTAELMVNHYEDEKAQQVYCLLDSGRVMKMPFRNMSLLDYAINSSLVISNTILKKHDRAGIISFADSRGNLIKASREKNQLKKIMESLYSLKESEKESDYDNLYHIVRKLIGVRSLLILFTNFESVESMRRVLPILRKINRTHLLVVVFFQNVPVLDYSREASNNVEEVYFRTSAESFVYEKRLIARELTNFGIQTILCRPEDLSISTINKYLELKSRGLI